MIDCIVVENEKPHSDSLLELLYKDFPEINVLTLCDNIPDAIQKVKELNPNLIFLDIELGPYTGFDLLEATKGLNYSVIFTTAHNKYAIKAIKFSALDYLMKPHGLEDLKDAILKYKTRAFESQRTNLETVVHNVKQSDITSQLLALPVLGGYDFVKVSDIILCKSDNNYTDIHMHNNTKITVTKTLKWVSEMLKDHGFYRVHDSYLINISHIKKYRKEGELGVVELTNKLEANVSRRKKEEFLSLLANQGIVGSSLKK